jgi:HD-GYP domain-containing protein (c-di-GMP phosphodiesterase class II)/pSer/pThr/pTyr-binding forkhead associated (FHA) protein
MTRLRLSPVAPAPHLPVIDIGKGESKTVGRGRQADVLIDDASLSRLHARLSIDQMGQLAIDDLGSTNGIFVNGREQLSGFLVPGDTVRFGRVDYLVSFAAAPTTPSPDGPVVSQSVLRRVTMTTTPKVDRLALEALLATSREMMAFDDLPALLERVLDRLAAILKPDRAAILLVDSETGVMTPRAVRPAGAYTSVSEFASSTVVHEALTARDTFIVHDIRMDARLQQAASVVLAGVRSVICVPLLGRSGPIGALYADKLGVEQFAPELAEYASAFAGHAAAALETARLYDDRERHFRATLEVFAKAIDARDRYTAGHSERVTAYSMLLARRSGQFASEFETIRRAGMLHDIGKVGVPDAVLLKEGPLDARERALIEAHVTIGFRMLEPLPFLGASLPAVRGHHERWDGKGYPDGLGGTDIHPHARLMAVADSYDAMTSARAYRGALPATEAARRLRAARGAQFDPEMIDLFDALEQEFVALHEEPDAAAMRAQLLRPSVTVAGSQ